MPPHWLRFQWNDVIEASETSISTLILRQCGGEKSSRAWIARYAPVHHQALDVDRDSLRRVSCVCARALAPRPSLFLGLLTARPSPAGQMRLLSPLRAPMAVRMLSNLLGATDIGREVLDFIGAPCGIRTHGPRIRNPVLYPSELRGRALKIKNFLRFCS